MKKILIVSYTLPPENGIGGRRWAKFAKVFAEKGYDIRVITSINKSFNSPWTKDISTYENSIIRIPSKTPYILSQNPRTIKEKLLYRFYLQKNKLFTKGNYYDKASLWRKEIQKQIKIGIKDGYNNIIITVAPYKTALWASELISEFPDVNFIVDFRDPWVEEILSKQKNIFSSKRIQHEIESEKKVIENFNYIVSVAEQMTNNYIKRYNYLPKEKFKTIPNGYDVDDLEIAVDKQSNNSIVFAGTFYQDATQKFYNFINALNEVKKTNPSLLNEFNFIFYSQFNFEYKHFIKNLPIEVKPPISLSSIHKVISKSRACMLFLSNDINYSLSTKFCEYIAYQKPVVVFSNKGYTADFVKKNDLGYAVNDENIVSDLTKALDELKKNNYTSDYNYEQYNIQSIISEYEKLLKK